MSVFFQNDRNKSSEQNITVNGEQWRVGIALLRTRRCRQCLIFGLIIIFIQLFVLLVLYPRNPLSLYGASVSLDFSEAANHAHKKDTKSGQLHVLILSYARTGSSFLGELLQSLPGAFYHYGPLHFLSEHVLSDNFQDARSLLDTLFRCNVRKIKGFLEWQTSNKTVMNVGYIQRSLRYWDNCSRAKACYNSSYIDAYCRNQKFIILKTNRLNLREACKLYYTHPGLNLKIIYLSRDPRGTMNSRQKYPFNIWCSEDPSCYDSMHYCSTLDEDLELICTLSSKRPNDFMVLRYEDLSVDPYRVASRLLKFLDVSSIPQEMKTYIKEHTMTTENNTKNNHKDAVRHTFSTFRNSSIAAASWRRTMSFETVTRIQSHCHSFTAAMGYHSYRDLETLRSLVSFDSDLDKTLFSACDKAK